MAEQKEKRFFSFNYTPLLTDFILRWLLLGAWRLDYIGDIWFWVLNILVIPILILISIFVYADRHSLKVFEDEVKNTTGSIVTTLFILIGGTYVTFNLYENIHTFWNILISVVTFFVYGLYVFAVNIISLKKPSSKKEIDYEEDQWDNSDKILVSKDINDSNDVDIVRLEGILNYTNDRVNSYILESALFSGLAFAGFITLITSDKLHISQISALLDSIRGLLDSLIYFNYSTLSMQIRIFTQDDLFIIILIESLFCTLAFVSVIASRLRFSDILEEVEISVKTARSFNDKEEEVALLYLESNHEQYHRRITYLNKKIEKEITIANKKLSNIKPILSTIRIIRGIGMIAFFSMIITSALLINSLLAFILLLSSILVAIIMNVDHSLRIKKVKNLNIHLQKGVNHTN